MRKILLILSALFILMMNGSVFAATQVLTTYQQLLQALTQGDEVSAVIYFDKCTLNNAPAPQNGVISRMNIDSFVHYKVTVEGRQRYTIATSHTLLVEHSQFGTSLNYVRLRLFEDNTAELHHAFYDPKTYEAKSVVNYICRLSNGADNNAITLYAKS